MQGGEFGTRFIQLLVNNFTTPEMCKYFGWESVEYMFGYVIACQMIRHSKK